MWSVLFYHHSVKDVMKVSSAIEKVDWDVLAGWLSVYTDGIRTDCNIQSGKPAQCYRRRLVEIYCEHTAKSPQQVAKDMARILENKMENKKVARKLRQLTFGEL